MRILIVKTSAIGDVIHTLPALAALRRAYPQAEIHWLVEEAASGIVQDHPMVDRVLVSGRRGWLALWRQGKRRQAYRQARAFVHQLRATTYDLLIDFQGLLKSGVFVLLARARRKVGFGRGMEHAEASYLFLNERVPPVSMDLHAVEREQRLLAALGIDPGEAVFPLPLTEEHHRSAGELLAAHGMGADASFIAVNPMTTWPTKHWPEEKFVGLADALLAQGHRLVFTGGPGDHDAVAALVARLAAPAVNLAGGTGLMELAAVYQRARLLVTTDTGPMHLAAAAGTPVVALFGPTAPWRTGPYGAGHQVVRLGLACSPCYKKTCPLGSHGCMADLAVEQVLAAVNAVDH